MVDPPGKHYGAGAANGGGGPADSELEGRQSQPSEDDVEEIILARRQRRSRAAASEGQGLGAGAMRKLRDGLFSEKHHRTADSTPSPPIVDHREGVPEDKEKGQQQADGHEAAAAPWENQELDMTILQTR